MPAKNKPLAWLVLFIALGFILRINNLAARSLWTDEFFTLFQSFGHGLDIDNLLTDLSHKENPGLTKAGDFKVFMASDARKGIKDVTAGLLKTDTHPPFYFWIMHFWIRIFGDTALPLRSFSVLLGLSAIFLSYKLGERLFDKQAGLFSALFVSISGFAVRYSQEARAYSLIMFLGLSSCLFLLRFEKNKKFSDLIFLAGLNSAGIYTHYFYAFILLAQFIYFTIEHRKAGRLLDKFYLSLLFCGLLILLWIKLIWAKGGYNFYIAEWIFGYPGLTDKIYYLFTGLSRFIFVFEKPDIFLLAGLILAVYVFFSGIKSALRDFPRKFFFCVVLLLVPALGMLFIDIFQHGALLRQERFWIFSFIGFIPLAGYSFSRCFAKNKAAIALLVIFMLISAATVSKVQFGPAPGYASDWINQESGRGHSAVFIYNIRSAVIPQSYYLNDDIYLIPVSTSEQLRKAVNTAQEAADKIFICQHFHPTDSSLMTQGFMDSGGIGKGFKFKAKIYKDNVSVYEYAK